MIILPTWLVNSKLYFNLYYKHTKRHKKEMREIREGVLKIKREMLRR